MLPKLNQRTSRDLLRWLLNAALLAALIAVAPDFWAVERLTPGSEIARTVLSVAAVILAVLLFRARHESAPRRFRLGAAIVTLLLGHAALAIGITPKTVAVMVVWGAVAWVEWRRLVDEERRFA